MRLWPLRPTPGECGRDGSLAGITDANELHAKDILPDAFELTDAPLPCRPWPLFPRFPLVSSTLAWGGTRTMVSLLEVLRVGDTGQVAYGSGALMEPRREESLRWDGLFGTLTREVMVRGQRKVRVSIVRASVI